MPCFGDAGREPDCSYHETAKRTTERGPMATLINVENCGHAPSLMTSHQTQLIKNWLRATEQLDEESEN